MNQQDKDILTLTVKNAVLEGLGEYHTNNVVPLETRVTNVEGDIKFAKRGMRGVYGVILMALAYFGIK